MVFLWTRVNILLHIFLPVLIKITSGPLTVSNRNTLVSCLYIPVSTSLTCSAFEAIENNKTKRFWQTDMFHTDERGLEQNTQKGLLWDAFDLTSVLRLTLLCFVSFTHPDRRPQYSPHSHSCLPPILTIGGQRVRWIQNSKEIKRNKFGFIVPVYRWMQLGILLLETWLNWTNVAFV